jgi:lysophospholipase L1-like esterase
MTRPFPFDARGYYYYYRGGRSAAALGGAFSPLAISPFLWLDPSDLSTLFQERTGASATTPSVVDGPVGSMHDKSANGIWLTAPSDSARPTLRNSGLLYWLEFDGVDDRLDSSAFTYPQPWDRVSGIRQIAWASGFDGIFGPLDTDPNGGYLFQTNSTPNIGLFDNNLGPDNPAATVGADVVVTERHDNWMTRLAIDNGAYTFGRAQNHASNGLSIGLNPLAGSYGNFRLYQLLQFDGTRTSSQTAQCRAFVAEKQGRSFASPTLHVLAHGDSITQGIAAGGVCVVLGYMQQLHNLLAAADIEVATTIRGIPGQGWDYVWETGVADNLVDDAAAEIDAERTGGAENWLIPFAGTNDIDPSLGNDSAAATAAFFDTYINARIAAGWDMSKTIVPTMLPRVNVTDSIRQDYNAALVTKAVTYGYNLCRLDLIVGFGGEGDYADTDYYSDGIHPTPAGAALIAAALFDIITA